MGIYDRDYGRDEPQGIQLGKPQSIVTILILVNVGLFLVDMVFFERENQLGGELANHLGLHSGLFTTNFAVWELLTYGFFHANISHVGWNMFGLWLWGRDVETTYGRSKFFWTYITLIIGAGLISALLAYVSPMLWYSSLIGASGAVVGIVVISACLNPMKQLLIWGVLPARAWVLATVYILADMLLISQQLSGKSDSTTAAATHLAGALLGFIIYRTGWTLQSLLPSQWSRGFRRRPRLRIHEPEPQGNLGERVDAVLAKISREGEQSLTKEERRILVDASQRYQRRRNNTP